MALRVWLPLNGSLENIGVSDIVFTNSNTSFITVDNNGKIGKCYAFNSTANNNGISSIDNGFMDKYINNKSWSICAWIKTTSADTCVISLSYGLRMFAGDSTHTLISLYNSSRTVSCTSPTAVNDGNWHHLAATYGTNTNMINFYIDGINVKATAYTSGYTYASSWTNGLFIGKDPNNSTVNDHYLYKGSLNDVRIYDHCLSAKEVKEIAQGLILHYKLNGWCGGAGENILPCGGLYTKENPWTTSLSRADGYAWVTGSAFEGEPSTTYTISVECDGTLSNTHGAGGLAIANKPWSFWAYVCNTNTSKTWQSGGYDTAINLNSSNNNYRKIGNAHVWTITLSSTQKYISLRTNSYSDGSTVVTINWWNMKIEKGNAFSSYAMPLSDLGIDTTKVIDSSGYGNDGNIVNTITTEPVSDGGRYQFSTFLPASTSTYIINNNHPIKAQTVSFWLKLNDLNSGLNIFSDTNSNLCFIRSGNSSGSILAFNVYLQSYTGTSSDKANDFRINTAAINFLDWNFFVIEKTSGGNILIYINGVQYSPTGTTGQTSLGNGLIIGKSSRSFNISDFRLYSTELSESDILDLYHTPANVDNLGGLHGFEFIDKNKNIFSNANIAITGALDKGENGVGAYTQSNCSVTYEDNAIRIYRPPNITHNSSTMHNMWGGMRLRNSSVNSCHEYNETTDNIFGLQKNHTYIIYFTAKGQSSNAATSIGWTNQMGWGGGGLAPAPTNVEYLYTPSNFNGEMECYYKFTVSDDVVKTCTTAYSYATIGKQYLSYNDFMYGFGYEDTGTLGTDVYINNFRLYDITDLDNKNIEKNGIINFLSFNEEDYGLARLHKCNEFNATNFIEK